MRDLTRCGAGKNVENTDISKAYSHIMRGAMCRDAGIKAEKILTFAVRRGAEKNQNTDIGL